MRKNLETHKEIDFPKPKTPKPQNPKTPKTPKPQNPYDITILFLFRNNIVFSNEITMLDRHIVTFLYK